MTLPEIIDRIKYRWNRSKTIPLAIECAYLYTLKHKCTASFLLGVGLGWYFG